MTMQNEAEAYANGAWDVSVEYVNEGNSEDSERFFDISVDGNSVPSGLLHNLQERGFMVVGVTYDEIADKQVITASPDY